jgi:hypothetical protein
VLQFDRRLYCCQASDIRDPETAAVEEYMEEKNIDKLEDCKCEDLGRKTEKMDWGGPV